MSTATKTVETSNAQEGKATSDCLFSIGSLSMTPIRKFDTSLTSEFR